jgi:hypothetical protein
VAGKGHDLVGGLERLLEAVELLARREILAIIVRLEGKQGTDEIAARARTDRRNLIRPARKRGVEKELRFGFAAKSVLGFLQLQSCFAKLTEDCEDGRAQVADDGGRQGSGTMTSDSDIENDGPWCGALGQGQDEAAARAGWNPERSRAPASGFVMIV